jgi:hypothetical protein
MPARPHGSFLHRSCCQSGPGANLLMGAGASCGCLWAMQLLGAGQQQTPWHVSHGVMSWWAVRVPVRRESGSKEVREEQARLCGAARLAVRDLPGLPASLTIACEQQHSAQDHQQEPCTALSIRAHPLAGPREGCAGLRPGWTGACKVPVPDACLRNA